MELKVALSAKQYTSVSADKSLLQEEYAKTFSAMCDKYEVSQPFELSDDRLREFFSEVSSTWKSRKQELYKEGTITAEQL